MEIVVFNEDNFLQLLLSTPSLYHRSAGTFPKFSEPCRFRGVRITIWTRVERIVRDPSFSGFLPPSFFDLIFDLFSLRVRWKKNKWRKIKENWPRRKIREGKQGVGGGWEEQRRESTLITVFQTESIPEWNGSFKALKHAATRFTA